MTGPKRPDPNDIAACDATTVAAANVAQCTMANTISNRFDDATISHQDKMESSTNRAISLSGPSVSYHHNNSNNNTGHEDSDGRCTHYVELQHDHHSRPYPLHPHQLAHQHTYPKISLTSIPANSCIKEEDEYGEDSVLLEKRRLSAQYMNNNCNKEMVGYGEPCYRSAATSGTNAGDLSANENGSNMAIFAHGSSMGATIPRTFSTSALRIKNRCSFWDRMYTPR